MGTIPSRREVRGLTPLRLRAWISVFAAANACRKYAANSGTPEHNGFPHKGIAGRSVSSFRSARHARDLPHTSEFWPCTLCSAFCKHLIDAI